jgi:hypothetical protein
MLMELRGYAARCLALHLRLDQIDCASELAAPSIGATSCTLEAAETPHGLIPKVFLEFPAYSCTKLELYREKLR